MGRIRRRIVQPPVPTATAIVDDPQECLLPGRIERHGRLLRLPVIRTRKLWIGRLQTLMPRDKSTSVVGVPRAIGVIGEEVNRHERDRSRGSRETQLFHFHGLPPEARGRSNGARCLGHDNSLVAAARGPVERTIPQQKNARRRGANPSAPRVHMLLIQPK